MGAEAERYDSRGLIGVGGMGQVHVGHDRVLEREVAIKTSLRQDEAARRRFEREAKLTARLDHPGIVPVHDIAVDAEGRSFYTMRLVRGRSLGDSLRATQTLVERLALLRHLRDACETVAFAHSRGVIHRDLKPDNLMIGEFGESQIVDWGLAVEDDAQGRAEPGVGTPRFASPEQRAGDRVDPRTDIWSLGAILHDLLTGRVEGACEALGSEAPPELAAICARAMATEPGARFDTAKHMADELTRYLEGRRVLSHEYSPWELLRRLVGAWRTPLAVVLAALVVVAVVGVSAWQRTQAERERALAAERDALAAAHEANRAREQADDLLARSLLEQALEAHARGALAEAELLAIHAHLLRPTPAALGVLTAAASRARPRRRATQTITGCERGQLSPDRRALLCVAPDEITIRSPTTLEPLAHRPANLGITGFVDSDIVVFTSERGLGFWDWRGDRVLGHHETASRVSLHHGGALSVLGISGVLTLFDARSGNEQQIKACPQRAVFSALAPDRRALAVHCFDRSVEIIALDEDERSEGEDVGGAVSGPRSPDFSPSQMIWTERGLLVASWTGELVGLDPVDGSQRWSTTLNGPITRLEQGPALLAVATRNTGVTLIEPETGRVIAQLPSRDRKLIGFDGLHELLTMTREGQLHRWQVAEATGASELDYGLGLSSAAVSPDGRSLALASGDGVVSIWSRETGRRLHEISWQQDVVKDVRYSPSGRMLAAASVGTVGVVIVDTETWRQSGPHGSTICRRLAWLAEDEILCLTYGDYADRIDLSEGIPRVEQYELGVTCREIDGPRDELALWCEDSTIRWLVGGEVLAELPSDTRAVAVRGELYARANLTTVELGARILDHAEVVVLAFTHDRRRLASASLDGTIRIWAVEDGRLLAELPAHLGRVSSLRFNADDSALVSASWDGSARIWELEPLVRRPESLRREIEAAWGLELDDVLGQ